MYRLYIDEVGTDDLGSVETDSERYLSLTGIAMEIGEARDNLSPKFASIKADLFDHDADDPLIFHRKKIVQCSGPFGCLRDDDLRAKFDDRIRSPMRDCNYAVISALIDKKAMLKKWNWANKQPYHYLMEVMVEKYAKFLKRKDSIGDIMPEGRLGKKDERLQAAFLAVKASGTYYASRDLLNKRIPSSNLKFRYKRDNIAGLQLADLIAHPSHMLIREAMGHAVHLGAFCESLKQLLMEEKYDRGWHGRVLGYGMKWLP